MPRENAEAGACRRTDPLLQRWRAQRRELACLLHHSAWARQDPAAEQSLGPRITLLCQALIDYLSAAHFAVYLKVLEECAAAPRDRREVLLGLYRLLESATDHALRFHDKYDTDPASLCGEESLPRDLCRLARVMRIRFRLEDLWIELLMTRGSSVQLPRSQPWNLSSHGKSQAGAWRRRHSPAA